MLKAFWAKAENRQSLLCLAILFVFTLVYFAPLLQGKVLPQGDVIKAKGMQQDVVEYREQYGNEPYWSDSMFGGMPTMTFSAVYTSNGMRYLASVLFLGLSYPFGFFFLGMALTFGLVRSYKVPPFGALAAAFGYGLFGYYSLIIEAGHYNKFLVLATAPGVLWGMSSVYRGHLWLGGIVFLLSLGMNLYYNHAQMTYYLALGAGVLAVFFLVEAILKKTLPVFAKGSALLAVLSVLALAMNAVPLKPLYDYSQYSTRGATELREAPENEKTGGLARDYAYAWSYSREEMLAVLVPNAVGGGSDGSAMPEEGETYDALRAINQPQALPQLKPLLYWGEQSFTAGPFYIGAVLLFLFALGGFLVKGPLKWGLLTVFSLSILLSLGQFAFSVGPALLILLAPGLYYLLHKRVPVSRRWVLASGLALVVPMFAWIGDPAEVSYSLYDLFFDRLPLANKFRVPSSMLVIAAFVVPWLGALGLRELVSASRTAAEKQYAVYGAAATLGGLCLLLATLGSFFFDFKGPVDAQFAQQIPEDIWAAIRADRQSVFTADALRSAGLILLAAALVWLYAKNFVKQSHLVLGAVALLVLADQWLVNRRVLNGESYQRPRNYEANFQPRPADQVILRDTTHYRVFPVGRNPFNDGFTPYFHNSVGGYNAAKMRRFNELATRYIQDANSSPSILNMLNARYFITRQPLADTSRFAQLLGGEQGGGEYVYGNRNAYGPSWFVRRVSVVEGPDEALAAVGQTNLRYTALLEKTDKPTLPALPDSAVDFAQEQIRLKSQSNTELIYETRSPYDRLAVLSEIYYPEGWTATLDGTPVDILRANYILRAVVVPKGTHILRLTFAPKNIQSAAQISGIASILTLLVVLGFGFLAFRQASKRMGGTPSANSDA